MLNTYGYFNSGYNSVSESKCHIVYLDYYQRGISWGEYEITNIIFPLFPTFEAQYVKKLENPDYRMRVVNLGSLVYAHEVTVDSFGVKTIVKRWLVDGQQRERHFDLLLTAINKVYPSIQLGDVMPVRYSKEGTVTPSVSHPSTDPFMVEIWEATVHTGKYKNTKNINSRRLQENYNRIYDFVANLGWSIEQMTAFVAYLKHNVLFAYKEVMVEDAGLAFIDENTNNNNLREYQIIKAFNATNNKNAELDELIEDTFENGVESLLNAGIPEGKIDIVFTHITRGLYAFDVGSTGKASYEEGKRCGQYLTRNAKKHGFNKSSDFEHFALVTLPKRIKAYLMIVEATATYNEATKYIHKLKQLGGDYVDSAMLSAVSDDDSEAEMKAKMNLVAHSLYMLNLNHAISNKLFTEGKYKPAVIEIMNNIRNKDFNKIRSELKRIINRRVNEMRVEHPRMAYITENNSSNNKSSRVLLQEVEDILIRASGEGNLPQLWNKDNFSTLYFTREHVVTTTFGKNEETMGISAFSHRSLLCLQGMIASSYNSQIGDIALADKLPVYLRSGGHWLGSLSSDYYNENGEPRSVKLRKWLAEKGIKLTPLPEEGLTEDFIEEHNKAFNQLVEYALSTDRLDEHTSTDEDEEIKTIEVAEKLPMVFSS